MADDKKRAKVEAPKRKLFGGWKPDAPDSRDYAAHALFGAPLNLPSESSLKDFVDGVNDQDVTSSCVAQAITKALTIRLAKLGLPAPPFSVLGLYAPARRRSAGPAEKLRDDGTFPRDAMSTVADIGAALEATWPFDPAKVDEDVPLDVFMEASKFVVFGWWRIYASGASRSAAIAQAISNGYPVVFGADLWESFFDYSGGTIAAPGPGSAGGHMMTIVGYRTRRDGAREFQVLNSWGTTWGEQGFCWLHEDVLADARCSDFYVIQVQ